MNNQDLLRLYNYDLTSEMSGAGGKGNSGNGRSGKDYIKSVKGKIISMDTCDKGMIGLYFVLLLLVLIMAGNLISNAKEANSISWILFTLTLFLGLGGIYCIYKGGKYKKLGLTIVSIASGVCLMAAMIMSGTSSSMRDKFSAHLATVLFVIVSIVAALITS